MSLTDAVAAQVLGEVHGLAQRIDDLAVSMEHTAAMTDASAHALIKSTRQVLAEAEEAAKRLHKSNTLPVIDQLQAKLKEHITTLDRTAGTVKLAADTIKSDARLAVNDAREAVRIVIGEGKANAAAALQQQAAAMMESATHANNARMLAIGGGIAAVVVLLAGIAGYVAGKDAGEAAGEVVAAWANSADGKVAYSLVRSGLLTTLTHCASKGWKGESGVLCSPFADTTSDSQKPMFFGWRLK